FKTLATTYESPLEFLTYNSNDEGPNQLSTNLNELYLPQNITAILLNDSFWQLIIQLYSLLIPYCGALNKLQLDTAHLYENKDENRFWEFASLTTKELGPLAIHLFRICVNAASVERLWSLIGFIYTNRRNRLQNKKVLAMCQIRASLNFTQQKKQICTSEATFNQTNVPLIIEQNETNKSQLSDWEQMLEDESTAMLEEKEEEHSDSLDNIKDDLLSNYKHPAIDNKAKWKLKNVFNMLFSIPNYM
ncbi:5247_t:CDS:2, partial [Cetraspora pellucida]